MLPTHPSSRRATLVVALLVLASPLAGQRRGQLPSPVTDLGVFRRAAPVVNAPVAPDVIYVGRVGRRTGLSVVDLNGFGQSTGDPTWSPFFGPGSEHHSKFPWNPNVAFLGSSLVPSLQVGTSTLDGGSAGLFTLTKNTDLDDLHVQSLQSVQDVMLGHPLDRVYNAGVPFACQAGGNPCASTGLRFLMVGLSVAGVVVQGIPGFQVPPELGNVISFAPHPNPPPIVQPATCADPLIRSQEPTSVDSNFPNLLVPGGSAQGDPALGIPPSGLGDRPQNAYLFGPSPPQASITSCSAYKIRQQIGHFLYVLDGAAGELVVLNSNTLEVLDRIGGLAAPAELAMDPNLRHLAVTCRGSNDVAFVDIDPASARFHEVVQRTTVGEGPTGIAWEPTGEDIVVCNEDGGSLSILSGFSFQVRLQVRGLSAPFAVAVTPRQDRFGSLRNVYHAWILELSGRVALFESGPAGVNGWGHDDVVARSSFVLPRPRAIQPDPTSLGGAVWVAYGGHVEPGGTPVDGGGAVSRVSLVHTVVGPIPLVPGEPPSLRGSTLELDRTIGPDVLGGVPLDLAFDDQWNLGALPGYATAFSPVAAAKANGKSSVRAWLGAIEVANRPRWLFVPVHTGVDGMEHVTVLDLATGEAVDTNVFQPGVQAIPAPGARRVASYFRQ